jgi:hypothetical protein
VLVLNGEPTTTWPWAIVVERNGQLQQRKWNGPKRMLLDIGHIVVGVWLLMLVAAVVGENYHNVDVVTDDYKLDS